MQPNLDRRVELPKSQVYRGKEDFRESDQAEKAQDWHAQKCHVCSSVEEKIWCHQDMESDILERVAEQGACY